MSRPAVTYMKREWKKVLPVFVLSVCYAAFVFILVFVTLSDTNTVFRLQMAYPEWAPGFEIGDVFISTLSGILDSFHGFAVIVFEALLIRKVFYQENRAGISDFLRILPIRERNKAAMKVCAGESVILGFCLLFGTFGSITNALLSKGLAENASIMPIGIFTAGGAASNTYTMLWQTSGMMFLALSAIFLVLFVAQSCIHNMPAAMFAGFGLLLVPYYYTTLYEMTTMKALHMSEVAGSFLTHYPAVNVENEYVGDTELYTMTAEWGYIGERILFLAAVILAAAGILVLLLHFRWNIRESNNRMINSPAVAEFIVTGLSISTGTAVALITGNMPYPAAETVMEKYGFFIVTLIVGCIVWALIHGVGLALMKRQRGA